MTANTADPSPFSQSPMPLFYTRPVPLNPERHAAAGVRTDLSFDFSRPTNAVSLVVDELFAAAVDLPVVFMKAPVPAMVAVVGLADKINLFLDAEGQWRKGTYIPAYVRRYPYIFAQSEDASRLTLCVDEAALAEGVPAEQAFFSGTEPTEITRQALAFCQTYHRQNEQTNAFIAALIERDLLIERKAEIKVQRSSGPFHSVLSGFYIVDEAKFKALPDDVFLEWRRKGWVAAVYAHLMSQNCWKTLLDLAAQP